MARKNEIVIIGAGKFGSMVAQKLSEVSKYTIIVIDKNKENIDALAKYVDNGFVTNLAIGENLKSLGIQNSGTFVLGIGDNVQDSVIIASIIKKNYPKARIIAKAADNNHADILKSLGIEEVISPELAAAR
jgi:Trk K+ transport system NAD-binding subunit